MNMRLLGPSLEENDRNDLISFGKWVLSIGDGTLPAKKGLVIVNPHGS
jgi:hypothetical protein